MSGLWTERDDGRVVQHVPGSHAGGEEAPDGGPKPPEWRTHRDYVESDTWTVADIEDVDRLFATGGGDGTIRVDLDGRAAPSAEIADRGEPVNLSVWFDPEDAAALVEQLVDALVEEESR